LLNIYSYAADYTLFPKAMKLIWTGKMLIVTRMSNSHSGFVIV